MPKLKMDAQTQALPRGGFRHSPIPRNEPLIPTSIIQMQDYDPDRDGIQEEQADQTLKQLQKDLDQLVLKAFPKIRGEGYIKKVYRPIIAILKKAVDGCELGCIQLSEWTKKLLRHDKRDGRFCYLALAAEIYILKALLAEKEKRRHRARFYTHHAVQVLEMLEHMVTDMKQSQNEHNSIVAKENRKNRTSSYKEIYEFSMKAMIYWALKINQTRTQSLKNMEGIEEIKPYLERASRYAKNTVLEIPEHLEFLEKKIDGDRADIGKKLQDRLNEQAKLLIQDSLFTGVFKSALLGDPLYGQEDLVYAYLIGFLGENKQKQLLKFLNAKKSSLSRNLSLLKKEPFDSNVSPGHEVNIFINRVEDAINKANGIRLGDDVEKNR